MKNEWCKPKPHLSNLLFSLDTSYLLPNTIDQSKRKHALSCLSLRKTLQGDCPHIYRSTQNSERLNHMLLSQGVSDLEPDPSDDITSCIFHCGNDNSMAQGHHLCPLAPVKGIKSWSWHLPVEIVCAECYSTAPQQSLQVDGVVI